MAITSDGTALSHRLYVSRGRLTMGLRVPTVAAFVEPSAARSGFAAVAHLGRDACSLLPLGERRLTGREKAMAVYELDTA